jgi:hypothetical protein
MHQVYLEYIKLSVFNLLGLFIRYRREIISGATYKKLSISN